MVPSSVLSRFRITKLGGRACRVCTLFALLLLGLAFPSIPSSAQDAIHFVEPGETLSEIAAAYGVDEALLLTYNGIADANTIYVGQRLRIPTTGQTPVPPGFHRVAAGDTLSGIAAYYGVTVADLMAVNGLGDADTLYSGQLLLLPSQAEESAPLQTAQPDPSESETSEPALERYVVQPGDTLSAISRRFGLDLDAVKQLNGIGDSDAIVVGQILRLPTPETNPPPPAGEATAAPSQRIHVVQAGETLTGIARRYGIDADALRALNDISDVDAIDAGQELRLPITTAAPAETVETADPTVQSTPPAIASSATVEPPVERSGNLTASLNRVYTVRFGDTLGRIALRLGVDADALRRLNRFGSLNAPLTAGQTLLLPATGDELRPQIPAREHVVEAGQTLSQIAQLYGLDLSDLLQANRIADPNAVFVGQRLFIPQHTDVDATTPPENQLGPARSGYYYYTVQPGDTLSQIAKQFDSTMLAIREYNSLPDNETVYAGLEVRIPYGAPSLNLDRPPVPLSGTRFVVSLSRQQCWVYRGERVLHSWTCSTGYGDWKTRTGTYAVQSKIANAKSNAYRLDMPYWLGIYDVGPYENGIHGLPVEWSTGRKIWTTLIGEPATFGCAMLDDTDAATLFRLAYLGMPVHVIP